MSEYTNLKNALVQVIKRNGNEEITGQILQDTLLAIINALGVGFQFTGEATPDTVPGTPDARVFYFAQQAGTYSNFDGLVLDGSSVAFLLWASSWSHVVVNIPTTPGLDARYLRIGNLASGTGQSTITAMTQKAVSDLLEEIAESLSTKANKVEDATTGNIPKLDGAGNLQDSGIPAANIVTRQDLNADACHGLAEAVVDTDSEGTRHEFTFRQSGGDGGAFYRRILGKTLVWNQLFETSDLLPLPEGVTRSGNVITVPAPGASFNIVNNSLKSLTIGHKYALIGNLQKNANIYLRCPGSNANSPDEYGVIFTATDPEFRFNVFRSTVVSVETKFSPALYDLTKMFGAGNEPSTADEFISLYPELFYAYNPAALISNDAVQVEMTGLNQWDEEWETGTISPSTGGNTVATSRTRSKNYIPVIGGTAYFFYRGSSGKFQLFYYNANKEYLGQATGYKEAVTGIQTTPENAAFVRFYMDTNYGGTYKNDICINLSDPAKNGTYEPYWKRVLPLGLDSFEIKDSQDNISTYDGGLKSTPTGIADEIIGETFINRVVRRPHIAADDTDPNVFTDGVNTDAPLATPVEYTLVNPIAHCIKVDEGGTEHAIQPENAALPSAPFSAIATYTMSIQRMVAKLRSL